MEPKGARRESILDLLHDAGGLRPGSVGKVHLESKVPEADVYGVATFYHLLADTTTDVFVCDGLSCRIAGCNSVMDTLQARGEKARFVSCVGRCDAAPATWDRRGRPETLSPALSPSS
ncbi:MAG: NAD(P)H-dependent oxidoreductase subunit E, partial [Thermoanaerobaculia bacterium]